MITYVADCKCSKCGETVSGCSRFEHGHDGCEVVPKGKCPQCGVWFFKTHTHLFAPTIVAGKTRKVKR